MQFSQIAILGPGLIGGSLALAVRQREMCSRLAVWSRDASEREATRKLGVAELVTDDHTVAVAEAELVILCTPPAAMPGIAAKIAPHLMLNAVVTDVASVKAALVDQLTAIFQPKLEDVGSRYVGAHPMAGGETSGLASARANLFEESVCLLTPLNGRTAPDATERIRSFWLALGTNVRTMTPQEHDEAVALVSHLPHVVAAALAAYVGKQPGEALGCGGSGWRDMTRLAGGSPELWIEILSRNRLPVTNALRGIIGSLLEVQDLLESKRDADLESFLKEARHCRTHPLSAPK